MMKTRYRSTSSAIWTTSSKTTSNSVELNWKPATDNVGVKEYQVLRNGELINTVVGTSVIDKN